MSPLEQALYNFLLEHRCEVSDPEYPDFCRCAQTREAKLRAALTPAQAKLLDNLLLDAQLKAGAEQEALFQYRAGCPYIPRHQRTWAMTPKCTG